MKCQPTILVIAMLSVIAAGSCQQHGTVDRVVSVGNPRRGAKLIAHSGCGSCHSIPGISGARGLVGPPLDNIGDRTTIAGVLPNTPANVKIWIEMPQRIVPGNVMPNMGINDKDAGDIAAYLYTLR